MKSNGSKRTDVLRRRICVIFPGALGDFICFLPALSALGRTATVDLFARSEFIGVAPQCVTVGPLDRPEISSLFASGLGDDARTKKFFHAYDEVYSWFASRDENFVLRLQAMTGGRARVFPFRPSRTDVHLADYYMSALHHLGDFSTEPVVGVRADATGWADRFCARHSLLGRPILAIAPGSGAREKNWPAEFFLGVIEWWKEAMDGTALLLVGPVEQERGGTEPLQSRCVVAENLDLSQLAALLARSDVYLGNDSGVSHLAAALGLRTLALFGPTEAQQWCPRGEKVILLRRGIDCSPCREVTMKKCPHRVCLTELHPAEVISVLAQLPEVVTLTR